MVEVLSWRGLEEAAPELAAKGVALFERTGVLLLGTVRRDGSPRISPVEPLFLEARKRYAAALKEKIGWAPEEPRWHLFVLSHVTSAALFFNAESERVVRRWRAGESVSEFRQKP